jgi:Tfp pilus assembly protein PilO
MSSRIVPVVLILIAFGLFFGYINPTYSGKIGALNAEIQSLDAALEAAERFSEKESELLIERDQIPEEGLARVESFLPDGVDNVQLILDLNALAARSGLQLSNFDVQTQTQDTGRSAELNLEADGPTESLELSVSAAGSYEAFQTFLSAVELSLRPMDLVALEIQDSPTGVYTYEMTFRIYWLR